MAAQGKDPTQAGNGTGSASAYQEMVDIAATMNRKGATNLVQMAAHSPMPWSEGFALGGSSLRNGEISKARIRNDWNRFTLRELCGICRKTAETNWFGTWAVHLKRVFHSAGFRFIHKEAREWTNTGRPKMENGVKIRGGHEVARDFAWSATVLDTWKELAVLDNAVIFWRRREDKDPNLPFLNVVPCENVDYDSILGDGVLKIHLSRPANFNYDAVKERHGQRMAEALQSRKPLEIKSWEDEEFDFRVWTRGKRGSGLVKPTMVSVLDDLEFLELIRVGDYNGAYLRKDVIRQTKKGYAITNGPLAGQNVHHLKRKQKETIKKAFEEINGAVDLTTNFDIDPSYVLMPSEFFSSEKTREPMRRLMNWGGFATLLLQEGLSRIHGVSPYLTMVLRSEVIDTREQIADFLQGIFESVSFLGDLINEAPDLRPTWSYKVLFSTDELAKYIQASLGNGLMSPPTARERYLDLDDEEESELMTRAHEEREAYTLPFEPKQGLVEKLFQNPNEDATPIPPSTED